MSSVSWHCWKIFQNYSWSFVNIHLWGHYLTLFKTSCYSPLQIEPNAVGIIWSSACLCMGSRNHPSPSFSRNMWYTVGAPGSQTKGFQGEMFLCNQMRPFHQCRKWSHWSWRLSQLCKSGPFYKIPVLFPISWVEYSEWRNWVDAFAEYWDSRGENKSSPK